MPPIDCNDLENKVKDAIRKKDISKIKICYRTTEECRYIQKCAETYISLYGILLTVAALIISIGISIGVTFFLSDSLQKIIGYSISFLVIGFLLWHSPPTIFSEGKYVTTCRRIILDAEERLIILDAEERRKLLDAIAKKNKPEEAGIQT